MHGSWQPLRADSLSALLSLHPRALHSLSRGDVPAIVISGALSAEECAAITSRLAAPLHYEHLGTNHG